MTRSELGKLIRNKMREIKFRARNLDKILGYVKWYSGSYNDEQESFTAHPCWMYSVDNKYWTPNYSLPGQARFLDAFTGLLDKNDKEIYEGDIVRIPKQANYKAIWEISFLRGAFVLTDGIGFRYFNSDQYPKEYKVIGNIYENPELLN